jgi:hypothetical protein
VAVGALCAPLAGCATSKPSARPAPTPTQAAYARAYLAGHKTGKAVYISDGKGAAVRETTWGGCTRRALDAKDAEADRGAWVRGCLDGVNNAPLNPPTATVTHRSQDPKLLDSFRAWARDNNAQNPAMHTSKLTTAQLTNTDYDIELTTTYTQATQNQAKELAKTFIAWWDGDHGKSSVGRNVLILASDGTRLAASRL